MANILSATVSSHDKDIARLILDRVRYTLDYYGNYFELLRKFHRNYLSVSQRRKRHDVPDRDSGGGGLDWRADPFIPYTFGTIEAATPRLVFAHFSQRPYVRMVGRGLEDHRKADKVTAVLDYDMERAEVSYKSILAFKSFLKYGITIGRVTYKREIIDVPYEATTVAPVFDQFGNITGGTEKKIRSTKQVKKFDGPWYEPVSVFNYFPDPLYYEIPDMRYNAELQLTSLQRMHEENEGYKSLTGKNLYSNLDRLEGMNHGEALLRAGTWLGDAKEETAAAFGFGDGMNRSMGFLGAPQKQQGDEVWLIHYWEKDRYSVLANGIEVVRDDETPYRDGDYIYFAANCFPIEFEFYGMGMCHPTDGLQDEMNAWRAIAIDQGKLNMMKPLAYDPESGLTELDFEIFPGAAVPVLFEGGKPLVAPLYPESSLPPETYQIESMLLRDWQNALGMNDYVSGGGPGSAGTASEASMLSAAAATRFKLQSLIGQERFLKKLAQKMFSRRQQFLDEYEVFRILGDQGYDFPKLGPEDLAGEFDYMPMGSVIGPNREVTRQQIIQFMTIAGANPVISQRLNWEAIMNELVLLFDLPYPKQFIIQPNQWSIPPQFLEKMLQIAIANNDQNLVEQLVMELQATQLKAGSGGGTGGAPGGQNPGTMGQEVGGAGAQGAGQIAAGPTGGMPTMGSMQAQAQGGPGV